MKTRAFINNYRFAPVLKPASCFGFFDINFQPKSWSVAELQNFSIGLVKQLYSAEETRTRRANFKRLLKTSPHLGPFAKCPEPVLVV